MKKILASLLVLLSIFALTPVAFADGEEDSKVDGTKPINVYVFTKDGCQYCAALEAFLAELETDEEYGPMFEVVEYQVWAADWSDDADLFELMSDVASELGDTVEGAPYLVIGETSFPGYNESLQEPIKEAIKEAYTNEEYVDMVEYVQSLDKDNTLVNTIVLVTILVVLVGGGAALVVFSRKANK